MKNKLFILVILLNCCTLNLFAQWQPDVRLTNDPEESHTSYARCVTASGNVVHSVWRDHRDGNYEIYYKRSSDGGISWGTDTRLTNNLSYSVYPSIAVSGSVVHIAWSDDRDGNYEIYYKRSTDSGIIWGADNRLTNNPSTSEYSSVSVSGLVVHVLWQDQRDGNYEIYYKRSTDGGASWEQDIRLPNNPEFSVFSSVSVSGSAVNAAWADQRNGNLEIYYKLSTDGGVSWGTDTRLTNNSAFSQNPSISVSGSIVHVVWHDGRDGLPEIYDKRSTDGGISWGADTRLTSDPAYSTYASVSVSNSIVHVVWNDDRDGNYEIYYKRSTDGGLSWGQDTRLTNNILSSSFPSISISGLVVHVIWTDLRGGNEEIYYKRDPTGNFVGITNINSKLPQEFKLYNNYPNPFNPSTTIRFSIPLSRGVGADGGRGVSTKLIVYDILGREAAVLVNAELEPGTYEVNFDASQLSSGAYYYRIAIHSDKLISRDPSSSSGQAFTDTKKMILVK